MDSEDKACKDEASKDEAVPGPREVSPKGRFLVEPAPGADPAEAGPTAPGRAAPSRDPGPETGGYDDHSPSRHPTNRRGGYGAG